MLTPTVMGYVALWILWGNTLLVALAAAQRAWSLLRRVAARTRNPLEAGEVVLLQGKTQGDGVLAQHSVLQTGRIGAGSEPTILWHDRAYESRIHGGQLLLADGEIVRIEPARDSARVWLSPDAMDTSSRCPDPERFSSAYGDARRVKGFARTVVAAIEPGTQVFAAGLLRKTTDGWSLEAADGELLVSSFDPASWARKRAAFVFALFIPGILACAAACTALALSEPVFESVTSKLGGLLGFVFFLLVLPAGTALRDHLREPHERLLRGRWLGAAKQLETEAASPSGPASAT